MWQDLRITHWPAQPHGYAQARYTPINPPTNEFGAMSSSTSMDCHKQYNELKTL
uniref:Uncharacterized protein n=1 Tax=Anguilla anguilla TaxID=7936 RepID=A0A0E9QYX9_ANGAN